MSVDYIIDCIVICDRPGVREVYKPVFDIPTTKVVRSNAGESVDQVAVFIKTPYITILFYDRIGGNLNRRGCCNSNNRSGLGYSSFFCGFRFVSSDACLHS